MWFGPLLGVWKEEMGRTEKINQQVIKVWKTFQEIKLGGKKKSEERKLLGIYFPQHIAIHKRIVRPKTKKKIHQWWEIQRPCKSIIIHVIFPPNHSPSWSIPRTLSVNRTVWVNSTLLTWQWDPTSLAVSQSSQTSNLRTPKNHSLGKVATPLHRESCFAVETFPSKSFYSVCLGLKTFSNPYSNSQGSKLTASNYLIL